MKTTKQTIEAKLQAAFIKGRCDFSKEIGVIGIDERLCPVGKIGV